ncbi:MAG: hypothetical protein UR28_C0021G0023 [Candidatus Peregrinibacteria bacterium GW2011_GWF2_33_10]|nr:MAG: hypothetical protein UR28_C0021G0023 [Candidatus Peregrinibacteria bacterium GW2011_GWF2_33_10]OGJ44367.1 MAG: hypothetical protein A2263_05760 [Candidatus Peregrinibacteria bacterium RIFOXYA2_FULL_33_21]OGJ46398.1 MAG: hypothetical protein A2272_01700 [Candidatus Peregrinibacteria bacterium RIFOXYA12_FULL_33_12]OGJ50162.1 MAG: hypothetical protein A2307_03250 [Candidatus Peregrinibacteria bacterium RIFOXYB2_FULL_33_20]
MKKIFQNSAETLLEIIVAIVIVGIGASASLGIISSAVRGNQAARDRLIALNLAREGLEVFINTREANVRSANYNAAPKCWRAIDIDNCSISSGELWGDDVNKNNYITILNPSNFSWKIKKMQSLIEANSTPAEEFRIYKINDMYVQTVTTDPTNFFRAVKVEKISNNDPSVAEMQNSSNIQEGDLLKLTAIIYFKNRTNYSKVEIESVISNY